MANTVNVRMGDAMSDEWWVMSIGAGAVDSILLREQRWRTLNSKLFKLIINSFEIALRWSTGMLRICYEQSNCRYMCVVSNGPQVESSWHLMMYVHVVCDGEWRLSITGTRSLKFKQHKMVLMADGNDDDDGDALVRTLQCARHWMELF